MLLDERQESILDFIVRDYIRTACPVSSLRISERKSLDLSPASIRNIMLELDEGGLLHQPHTSAGRAPTEKGYRYFVDNLMGEKTISENTKEELDRAFLKSGDEMFESLAVSMANRLKLFSGILADGRVFKYGLSEVLREPEFEERDFLLEFAEFADNIEHKLESFEGIRIGNFSVVSSTFGPKNIIFIAGPKRMDYEKASSIIRFITKNV
ncbi:MAG TPA: hypothetical protein VJH05_00975 [Candidatus Paceibacterota bacterium]